MRLRRTRRPVLRTISVLPTMVTAGNLLAGTLALVFLQGVAGADADAREMLWVKAAWMVLIGMFCDALDGRLARLTRSSSAFGAQLDSLADVVTFGVVPAMLARSLLGEVFPIIDPRLLTALVVLYVVGAALRLARYNVESARLETSGVGHMTLVFRGLPSPAAAGAVASLVLLRHEYDLHAVDWAILLVTPALGLLMISRLPYPHLLNQFLDGSRPLFSVVLLVMLVFLVVTYFFETTAAAFFLYVASGVLLKGLARVTGRPRWALGEAHEEAAIPEGDPDPSPEPEEVEEPSAVEAPPVPRWEGDSARR